MLHAGGKHILLGDGRIDQAMDETLSWSFLDLGVDGLVLAGSVLVSPAVTSVASRIPTVAVGGLDPGLPRVDVLASDNHLGGTLAVRHLIDLGHRRIAHISGLPGAAGQLRLRGYEDAMRGAGLAADVAAGDMTEEGGYRAAVQLLSRADRPTAIFAANDLSCTGALSAAAALGIRVPQELSLVGFDNSSLARLRALWLTSVDGAHARHGPAGRPAAAGPHRAPRRARPDPADAAPAGGPRIQRPRPGPPRPGLTRPAPGGLGDLDVDRAVLDPGRVGAQVDQHRRAERLAAGVVEPAVVLRALDDAAHDQAVAQQRLLVGAVAVGGVVARRPGER